jgi:hypothetical protein
MKSFCRSRRAGWARSTKRATRGWIAPSVPVELLTDEELEFYRVLAEKARAIPIEAPKEPPAETS